MTILEIPQAEQEEMLRQLRLGRFGYLLALHILLLCASGRTPTEISEFLFCSRSSVYRITKAYRDGLFKIDLPDSDTILATVPVTGLAPSIRRCLIAILKSAPSVYGWCRARWSCAALAAELKAKRGLEVSAETVRRWLHQIGWEWKRAKLTAKDDDPERTSKLARIRYVFEHLRECEAMFFADEIDINLLAKVGYQWMPKGIQVQVMTPGTNKKKYLAGALNIMTGKIIHRVRASKTTGLFLDLLAAINSSCPATRFTRIYVVADNYKAHKAEMVHKWLATHPRFELLYLPTYCPRSNPIERAFGDVHDKCTRNHKRKRLGDLVKDVEAHLRFNGPWKYKLSEIYYEQEITDAMNNISANSQLKIPDRVYQVHVV